jgi:hypothetical protein
MLDVERTLKDRAVEDPFVMRRKEEDFHDDSSSTE